MKVKVSVKSVSVAGATMKAPRARAAAIAQVTEAARLDTDPYVPMREGDLAGTASVQSRPTLGKLIYGQPYARAQYYGLPGKSKARHPKAIMQWFEVAKRVNVRRWRRIAASEYERLFKRLKG
jgi:hypothetical protein